VRHCVQRAKGKKGQTQFTYNLFSLITGFKTNMLLTIMVGLFAKITLVSSDCEFRPLPLKDFDWNKVGVGVLTRIL